MPKSFVKFHSPLGVCWNITARCHANCDFCYRPPKLKELSLGENIFILKKLQLSGVRKISWAGGEPTLYKFLVPLAIKAKLLGCITSLTTNASETATLILSSKQLPFDWITLPLDAATPSGQVLMSRPEGHYERVLRSLDYLSQRSGVAIKVNTVVTALNIGEIVSILNIIADRGVKRWKLFRFIGSRCNALVNRNRFELDDQSFAQLMNEVEKARRRFPFVKITVVDTKDYSDAHFNILPNGDVERYANGIYSIRGNLLTDEVCSILDGWNLVNQKVSDRYSIVGIHG